MIQKKIVKKKIVLAPYNYSKESYAQKFTNLMPIYKRQKLTGKLKKVGDENLKDKLQSYTGLSLDKLFEKFTQDASLLNDGYPITNDKPVVFDVTSFPSKDTLFELSLLQQKADKYVKHYKLDSKMNIQEVFDYVQNRQVELSKDNKHNVEILRLERLAAVNAKKAKDLKVISNKKGSEK